MRIRRRIVWGLLLLAILGIAGAIGGFYAAGYRAYIIHTGSMTPTLVPGDLVIDRPADDHFRAGDVITFRHGPTDDLVTHRITTITPAGVHTKGDANRTADAWTIPDSYVEGVARWDLPLAGYAVVFLRQPTGFASIVVTLVGLVLLWQLFFPAEQTARAPDKEPDDATQPDPEDTETLPPSATEEPPPPGAEPARPRAVLEPVVG